MSTLDLIRDLRALGVPEGSILGVVELIENRELELSRPKSSAERSKACRQRKRVENVAPALQNDTKTLQKRVAEAEPRARVLSGEESKIKELPTVVRKTEPSPSESDPDLFGGKPPNVTSLRSAKKAAEQRLLDFVGESWNAFAAECPRACAITLIPDGSERERLILARSRDLVKDHEYSDAETGWKAFFAKIRGSPFLRGEAKPGIGRERSFKPRLDAMIAPAFFLKIMEPDSQYGPEISIKRNTQNGYGAHR